VCVRVDIMVRDWTFLAETLSWFPLSCMIDYLHFCNFILFLLRRHYVSPDSVCVTFVGYNLTVFLLALYMFCRKYLYGFMLYLSTKFYVRTSSSCTVLLVGRSRDRSPVVSLVIFFPKLQTEPCALGPTQPLKLSTRKTAGGEGGRCVRVTTLPPS
jgi:hypothetical protein